MHPLTTGDSRSPPEAGGGGILSAILSAIAATQLFFSNRFSTLIQYLYICISKLALIF